VTSALAAAVAVDSEEASGSERRQEAARDGSPEAPAEIRVVPTRSRLRTVFTVSETAERRHSCRLKYNCNNTRIRLSRDLHGVELAYGNPA